jgi:hypothetical protein
MNVKRPRLDLDLNLTYKPPESLTVVVFDAILGWSEEKQKRMLEIFYDNVYRTMTLPTSEFAKNALSVFLKRRILQSKPHSLERQKALDLLVKTVIFQYGRADFSSCGDIVTKNNRRYIQESLNQLWGLTSLSLNNCYAPADKWFKTISRMPHLRSLNIRDGCYPETASLHVLSNLPKLNSLEVDCFSPEQDRLTRLTELDVNHLDLSDPENLKDMINLRLLRISGLNPPPSTLNYLTNLEELSIATITHGLALRGLTKLQSLQLDFNKSVPNLDYLQDLTRLTNLELLHLRIGDHSQFRHLTFLKRLSLRFCSISNVFFQNIALFGQLNDLELNYSDNIANPQMQALAALTNLASLSLCEANISSTEPLQHLSLKKLSLSYCKSLNEGHTDNIIHMTSLKTLDLNRTNLGDRDMRNIATLVHLTYLDISGLNNITDDGLLMLGPLEKINTFRVNHCPYITGKGLEIINKFRHLEYLGINDIARNIDNIFDKIPNFRQLKQINMRESTINNAQLLRFKSLYQLQEINLSGARKVSIEALNKLKGYLPQCTFQY